MFTKKPGIVNQMNLRAVALSIFYWNIYQPCLLSKLWNIGPACPPNPRKVTDMYRSLKTTLGYLLLRTAGHKIQAAFQILLSIHFHGTYRWISTLWACLGWDNISLTINPTEVLLVFQRPVFLFENPAPESCLWSCDYKDKEWGVPVCQVGFKTSDFWGLWLPTLIGIWKITVIR